MYIEKLKRNYDEDFEENRNRNGEQKTGTECNESTRPKTTRSGRMVKTPARLKDYVL